MGAKVSFIAYPFFVPLEPFKPFGSIKVLSEKDIAVMKIIAISQRGRKRDFLDLYWYSKNREPFDVVISKIYKQYSNINHNFQHIVKSLTFFNDAENDPMPNVMFKVSWQEVKAYFRKTAVAYAKKLLER